MHAALFAMAAIPLFAALATSAPADLWPTPRNLAPTTWTLIGPFPTLQDGVRKGFETDYLLPIGGEAEAKLAKNTEVGATRAKSVALTEGQVNLAEVYGADAVNCVAYAYAEWSERSEKTYSAFFGSDDGAEIWMNGERIHSVQMDRGIDPEGDQFQIKAKPGRNRILIKIDQGTGGWGFALKLLDDRGLALRSKRMYRQNLELLQPGPVDGRYILDGVAFPEIGWRRSDLAKAYCTRPPEVQWYDAKNNRVSVPIAPGRYTAVAEWTLRDGTTYQRYFTFFRPAKSGMPDGPWVPFNEPTQLDLPWSSVGMADADASTRSEFSRHVWRAMGEYMGSESSASLLIRLNAPTYPVNPAEPDWLGSGFVQTAQAELDLRMKIEGRKAHSLALPAHLTSPARALTPGTEAEAGLRLGTVEKLRALCDEWLKDDPHPFVVLVARNGKEVMREGFGGFNADSKFYPASIGKGIAGITIARAVDQGLFSFDQRLSTFFPTYKTGPASQLTFRHCFNHVTGLKGHASYGGLYNPVLDRAFGAQELQFEKPGVTHLYNGDGYNLAGKALEVTTGKTFFRTLYETMHQPFGEEVTQFDNGFGDKFSARFLAKVGMMLIQDGAYGDYRFFSPGFVRNLTPYRVADHIPTFGDKSLEWGIGLTWMPDEGDPLGKNVFGHGAASASVWRVAPDHDLVVVIGRDGYKDYAGTGVWAAKFMRILADGFVKE